MAGSNLVMGGTAAAPRCEAAVRPIRRRSPPGVVTVDVTGGAAEDGGAGSPSMASDRFTRRGSERGESVAGAGEPSSSGDRRRTTPPTFDESGRDASLRRAATSLRSGVPWEERTIARAGAIRLHRPGRPPRSGSSSVEAIRSAPVEARGLSNRLREETPRVGPTRSVLVGG